MADSSPLQKVVVETGRDYEPTKKEPSWWYLLPPVMIGTAILGGFAFRWLNLQRWSLWWDEGFTAWASGLPVSRIIPFARSDNQAPLYYLLQHYWDQLFGNSEFALRALSACFGTLAMLIFYLLAKRVLQERTAVAVAFWLFAFSLKQIWYSREARTYTAASFFALAALYALVIFLSTRSSGAFATIILSSALTLYLHNMMFLYLLGLDIVWLVYPSERSWRRRVPEMLLANALMGLLYAPLVVTLLSQVTAVAGNLYWVPRPTLSAVARTLTATAGFDMWSLAQYGKWLPPSLNLVFVAALRAALVLLCGTLLIGGLWRVSSTERKKNLCFLIYCLFPIFAVVLLSLRMPLYIDRVFTTSSIATPLIFALPLATKNGAKGRQLYTAAGLAIAGIIALSSFAFFHSGEWFAKNREDWHGVTRTLLTGSDMTRPNRLVLFAPPFGEVMFDYYSSTFPALSTSIPRHGVHEDFYARFPPPKSRIITEQDIDRLGRILASQNYSEVDLVLTHDVDPQGLLVDFLDHHFVRQDEPPPNSPRIQIIPFRAVSRP